MKLPLREFATPGWLLIGALLAGGGAVGAYQMFGGHLFATNDALVWTLPLITYIFLALMSTGVSLILAYGLITGRAAITACTRPLLIVALGLLVGGFTALGTELGSLLNMVWTMLSPNPRSPIWWMATLYTIELALLAFKLVRDLRGQHGAVDRPLAWATLVVAAAAAMTIGAVFGTVAGRPDYHGSFLSVVTLVAALASGAAVLVLLQVGRELTHVATSVMRQSTLLLAALVLARVAYESQGAVIGALGWASVWLALPLIVAAVFVQRAPRPMSLVVILGVLAIEYSVIVTGQLVSLGPAATWFGAVQSYRPNAAELAVFGLGVAVAAALIRVGNRLLLDSRETATPH